MRPGWQAHVALRRAEAAKVRGAGQPERRRQRPAGSWMSEGGLTPRPGVAAAPDVERSAVPALTGVAAFQQAVGTPKPLALGSVAPRDTEWSSRISLPGSSGSGVKPATRRAAPPVPGGCPGTAPPLPPGLRRRLPWADFASPAVQQAVSVPQRAGRCRVRRWLVGLGADCLELASALRRGRPSHGGAGDGDAVAIVMPPRPPRRLPPSWGGDPAEVRHRMMPNHHSPMGDDRTGWPATFRPRQAISGV